MFLYPLYPRILLHLNTLKDFNAILNSILYKNYCVTFILCTHASDNVLVFSGSRAMSIAFFKDGLLNSLASLFYPLVLHCSCFEHNNARNAGALGPRSPAEQQQQRLFVRRATSLLLFSRSAVTLAFLIITATLVWMIAVAATWL